MSAMPQTEHDGRRPSPSGFLAALKDRAVRRLLAFTGTQKFLTIQLDITNACNLTCAHCYHSDHSNAGALDLAAWRKILDQYGGLLDKLFLRPSIVLCGGEPTISPLFWPIVDEISTRWPEASIVVLTNATRLNEDFVGRLKDRRVAFQISLDGPDQERHDAIRGSGNFDMAVRGLRNLQAAGMNASFLATLSHRSLPWIGEFFSAASRLGVSSMDFVRFVPQGYGRLLADRRVDRPLRPDELRAAYSLVLERSRATGVVTNTNLPLYRLLDPKLGAHGKVGFQSLVVDYRGNLKVSSRVDYRLGSILDEGLETLFLKNPVMQALRDRRIEGCGACAHYEHCGGDRNASFVATGSFLEKDPGCWLTDPKEDER